VRQSIGLLLGAARLDAGSVEASPSETSPSAAKIIDTDLAFGSENERRGRWVFATDSNSATHLRRVINSSPDERSLTVSTPFPSVPDSGWTYELWDEDVSPAMLHELMNQAISETTRKGAVQVLDESMHTGGGVNAWPLSSAWTGIKDLLWRSSYKGEQIAPLDVAMSSFTIAEVSADSADFREGRAAAKMVIGSGATAQPVAQTASFAPKDLRGYDRLELWFKTNAQISSSNFLVQLYDDTDAMETLRIPATLGDSWTYAVLQLGNPEANSSITSLQVRTGSSSFGSVTLWMDDVKAVQRNTEVWHTTPRDFWQVDQPARKVMLKPELRLPYAKFRAIGVRAPALLSADSDICEVDAQYVVHSAAAKALRSRGDRRGGARDAAYQQADLYEQLAQSQRLRMSPPANVRWLDD
jgi:hypothetical protein